MKEETAGWPDDARAAAAVVAAAHDLGKLVAYRRVAPDRWIGVAATPHDTLSAILLAQCPAWAAFASADDPRGGPPVPPRRSRPRGAAGQRAAPGAGAPRGPQASRRRRGPRGDARTGRGAPGPADAA